MQQVKDRRDAQLESQTQARPACGDEFYPQHRRRTRGAAQLRARQAQASDFPHAGVPAAEMIPSGTMTALKAPDGWQGDWTKAQLLLRRGEASMGRGRVNSPELHSERTMGTR